MEITSFILGVCAVIVIMMVVGTFVNYMSTKQLKEQVDKVEKNIYDDILLINHTLEKLKEDSLGYTDMKYKNLENDISEIYRYIDSRLDKTENKFSKELVSSGEVKKALDEINHLRNRLNEFITTYQNQ